MLPTQQLTRPDFIRRFIAQLDEALTRDVRVLRKLDEKYGVPDDLRKPIERVEAAALDVIYGFYNHPHRVTKSDRTNVRHLEQELIFFLHYFNKVAPTLNLRLARVIRHFLGDIDHFVFSFKATLNSFNPGARIPRRPIHTAERAVWANIVSNHLYTHGVFPRHPIVYSQMRAAGFSLSKETHGDWKKRYLAGNF